MNQKELNDFREILMDFLSELPPNFDAEITSLKERYDLVDNFMKRHGLTDDKTN